MDIDFKWPVATQYAFYYVKLLTEDNEEWEADSDIPLFPGVRYQEIRVGGEEDPVDQLHSFLDSHGPLDSGTEGLMIAPASDSELQLQEIEDDDSRKPYVELLNLDSNSIRNSLDFINKWGLLGVSLRWRALWFGGGASRQNTVANSTVLAKPNQWIYSDSNTPIYEGANYFRYCLIDDPNKVYMNAPYSPARRNYNLIEEFHGWPFYGEWIEGELGGYEISFMPALLSRQRNLISSFNEAVQQFQQNFRPNKNQGPDPNNTSSSTNENRDSRITKMHEYNTSEHPAFLQATLNQEDNQTQLKSMPRTLLDYCQIKCSESGFIKCLLCHDYSDDSPNGITCEEDTGRFRTRRSQQTGRFMEWLDENHSTLSSDAWPVKTSQNQSYSNYHPAERLPEWPKFDPDTPALDSEELEAAKQWIEDQLGHNATKPNDPLKKLILQKRSV